MAGVLMPDLPALIWLGAGLVLLVAEVLVPGAFLMWIGLAALGTGAAVLLGLDRVRPQVGCFAVLSAGSIAVGPAAAPAAGAAGQHCRNSGLVGRTAHALAFEGGEGRVRLGDSDWPARLAAGAAPPAAEAAAARGGGGGADPGGGAPRRAAGRTWVKRNGIRA